MNIFHLKYFVVLAKKANYREAAQHCNISQPAMSMAIKSLEQKLGHPLIYRQKNPIRLTDFGLSILSHAKKIVNEYDTMMDYGLSKNELSGRVRLGIIPTIASSLIPQFIGHFIQEYPNIKLDIEEMTTVNILSAIDEEELDAGIVATPLEGIKLSASPMYYEDFIAYSSRPLHKKYIIPSDLDIDKLWLLEEGHCLRSQVINLCELRSQTKLGVNYSAGSIETLINLVDSYGGITIIPELYAKSLSEERKSKLMLFDKPAPAREISLIFHKYSVKQNLLEVLKNSIGQSVPNYMKIKDDFNNVPIEL